MGVDAPHEVGNAGQPGRQPGDARPGDATPGDGAPVPVPDDTRTPRQRWRARAPLFGVLAITLFGLGAVVYDSFAPTTEEPLDAHSHTVIADACHATYLNLRALPPLTNASTRTELASRTERENTEFAAMVTKFDRLTPPNADGRRALHDWNADWRAVLVRRASYVQELRASPKRAELVLPRDSTGAPITDRMNQYARTHALTGCLTSNLQAETVDTIRQYPTNDTVNG